jgi:hypothetical protein
MYVSLDSVDCANSDEYDELSSSDRSSFSKLHEKIFILDNEYPFLTQKMIQREIAPLKVGGSAEGEIVVSWGGKEGTNISVGVSGEIHDNKGNFVKGGAKQDNSGEGRVSVAGGYKEEIRPK